MAWAKTKLIPDAQVLISEIEIQGNKKIEKDAVLGKIKSNVSKPYDAEAVRNDILTLFKTGFFSDIQVHRIALPSSVKLVFVVVEKPTIGEIVFSGNSEMKSEELLETSGLKTYEILNETKIKEATEKIQKMYEDKGYLLVKVDSVVEDITPGQTVRLQWKIVENDKVKVKKITFIGNVKFKDGDLKSKIATNEGGYFSFLSGSGQYKQETFERDLQILRFYYYSQGYVRAKVEWPQVSVTPDKKYIYITIHIEEGEQYRIGEIDFGGDLLFPKSDLFESIQLKKEEVFAYDVLQKDILKLTAKYGDLGYAYANAIPRYQFRDADKQVDLLFEMDKGNKVYFGKFNVLGNTKTRDKVIRRELKILEGELYNETRRRESEDAIRRLGFFEEVTFKTAIDPKNTDIMNLDVLVKERSTGQIQFGAGYGSASGFTMQGSVSQTNFLGKGQNLSASLSVSSAASNYSLSFTEPYYNDSLWSLGGDIYQSRNDNREDYNESHAGGSVRTGYPITNFTRLFFRYKYDQTSLDTKFLSGKPVTDLALFPLSEASGDTSSGTLSLEYDTRNDRFMPTKGQVNSLSVEYAGLGGSIKYLKTGTIFRYYKNIFWDVVFRNSLQYDRVDQIDGNPIPFTELFVMGGPYSLRGYRSYRVGKMKLSETIKADLLSKGISALNAQKQAMRFVGGLQQALYQGELQFPLIKEANIMGVGFFDVGSAEDELIDTRFFSDVGFGLRWFSPIGPLRFEWGFPLNRDPDYHDPTVFEFSIGAPF